MRDDPPKRPPRPASRPPKRKIAPLAGRAAQIAEPAPPADPAAPQRIAKVIARAGTCSRRDAEAWIAEGRVALNGAVLTSPAVTVGPHDVIAIDGAPLAARARTRLFLFHKPRGLVTTERDPEGRRTIFDHLRAQWPDAPRLVGVGRLDINTEGLMLLTNDGGLARVLELPSTGWVRRYRVRANGATDQAALDRLRGGIVVDGVAYAEIEATLDRVQGANCWLTMALREGKNREVKRVLEHLGLEVNRLIRLSFGPFQLADLLEGALEEVKTRVLRDQLGPALAAAAGVVFAGPSDAAAEGRPQAAPARAGRNKNDAPDRIRREAGPPRRTPEPRADVRQKPTPGARKHVSALRGEAAAHGGPRKRTLRSATADRSGRAVPVERLVAVERAGRSAPRGKPGEDRPASRNGRRFKAERAAREETPDRRGRSPYPGSPTGDARPQRRGDGGGDKTRARGPSAPDKDRPRPGARTGAPRRFGGGGPAGQGAEAGDRRGGRPGRSAPDGAPQRFKGPKQARDGGLAPRGSGRPPGGGQRPGGAGGPPRGVPPGKGRPRGKT